jgi:hypothetical protein
MRRCPAAAAADARAGAQTEIIAFSDRAKEFAAIDTAVRSSRRNGRLARPCSGAAYCGSALTLRFGALGS